MKLFLATCVGACLLSSSAIAQNIGVTKFAINAPHHNKELSGAIFYPTKATGEPSLFADNPVFKGFEVQIDAPLSNGSYPVILLSHGYGGTHRALGWLAKGLAEKGAIIIGVDHPNTTWRDFDLQKASQHWTRAQDLTLALDYVMDNQKFSEVIDPNRVMAAGFSYGGHTALLMGGIKGDHESFVQNCETLKEKSNICESWLGVEDGLKSIAPETWNASYKDKRVTHSFAIDPGFVYGYSPKHLDELVENITLIGFGDMSQRLVDTDFQTSGLSALLPQANIKWFEPAYHFSAMPECKPAGPAILASENDDPVCTDPKGSDRAQIHQIIIEMAAKQLGI